MRRSGAFSALAGLGLLLAVNAQTGVLTGFPGFPSGLPSLDKAPAGFATQASISFQSLGDPPSGDPFEIPLTDPLVARTPGTDLNAPDQIHVTMAEGSATAGGSVWVSWSTGNYSFYPNQQAPSYPTSTIYAPQFADPASYNAVVMWGLSPTGPFTNTVTGYSRAYIQTYLHNSGTFVSSLLHHVHVTGIPYGTPIYYKCGSPVSEMSAVFPIVLPTSLRPQTWTYPMRLGVVADVGQTYNSSVTYQQLVLDKPDVVTFIGDLSYADDFNDQGGDDETTPVPANSFVTYANTSKSLSQTYQPKWETMTRLISRSGNATSLPYFFAPGNHEIERDEYLRPFQSYINRFRSPYEQSYSFDPLYYSLDVGPAHMIMLNNYGGYAPNVTLDVTVGGVSQILFGNSGGPAFEQANYPQDTLGAEQLSWFLNDLARVNRTNTPWVIVAWHAPSYNSYSTHYRETDCLREMIEPFMYNAGVDIILHGHVHAYERVFQVLNYQRDGCAPRWLTMGDGGNIEGLYKQFAATNCQCPAGTSSAICPCANVTLNASPQFCHDNRVFNAGGPAVFAPVNGTQPDYSAFREPSYGHGIIDFINSTTALWTWVRNQDGTPIASDSVYFVKNLACPNQKGVPLTPPATPAPPVTTSAPATTVAPATTAAPAAPVVPSQPSKANILDGLSAAKNAYDTGVLGNVLSQQQG